MGCSAVCLTLLALLAGAYAQTCMLITPNILRLESEETIVVDGQNRAFDADILVQDFPQRRQNLAQQKVSLNNANQFLGTAKVTIPSKDLVNDKRAKQYVYVSVKSPSCNLEKVVLVGHHSGYVIVQTDKTIYTPGSTVLYRLYLMNYKMSPVTKAVIVEFLTPENIIVKRDTVKPDSGSGIISLSYKLPELVSIGVWTISAKFEDSPNLNHTNNFEVKEYVLPTFEIQMIPDQKFLYIDDDEFIVNIRAKYLYGKPVEGTAFAIFGVKKDGVKTSFPDTLKRIQIAEGEAEVSLNMKVFERGFQKKADMLQYSLYMSVTVITDSGSEMVESELENINIVTAPHNILFTKTSKYFKPGMPFDLMVFVTNPDGSPANRVLVVAEPGKVQGVTGQEGTARLTLNTAANIESLPITVKTARPDLPPERQASASMTALAQKSNGNYLHIGITNAEIRPGENVAVNFNIRNTNAAVQNQISHFTYLVMNKGRILKVDRQMRLPGQALVTMSLPVTVEFIPSIRIVAYYLVGNDIVSDSIWLDVEDTCMGTLVVTGNTDRDNRAQSPGTSMKLKLRTDHKSVVGLVAVDKGVYVLNNKYKLTQSKIWDLVERSDIGCTPGSGANSLDVFYDAGLALQMSTKAATKQRSEHHCESPPPARKRRSTAQLIAQKNVYASKYKDLQRQCCVDGMNENPMGHTCERRASYILEGKECVDAYIDCCTYFEKKKKEEREGKVEDIFGRSDEDENYLLDADIVVRSEFPESWFWKTETVSEKPDNQGISTKVLNVFLKDSITTWEVQAISLSANKGICVGKPYEIQVMKDFFIDLKLPYSVVRNEQVEIRAILYNYGTSRIKVRVEFSHNPEFCSLSTTKAKYRQMVEINPHSSTAVPFIIIPLNLGFHDVEVKAAVFGQFLADGVKKKLRVVPEGNLMTKNVKTEILEPTVKGNKEGVQTVRIDPLDEKNIVPRTDVETVVMVQGSPISQMVEDSIEGSNLTPLIVIPRGCGEQNMITMTPGVIATTYLDSTGQWERIGVNRREEAIKNIKTGYTQQLVYRKTDNSYAAFKDRPASTWLTAYVAKVFAMARPLMDIESEVLCGAVKWLILQKQKPDGLFKEDAPVIHKEMIGGLLGTKEPDVALTSFVLIAMLESEVACTDHVNNLKVSIDKASSFILGQYESLTKPYTIAIASYALTMAGRLQDSQKLMSAATDNNHWEEPGARHITLEATSYALLALVRLKQFDLAGPIVRWLVEQRFYGQVYGSTQATIVMFQALAQYQTDASQSSEMDMDVSIKLPGRSNPIAYRINLQNAVLSRSAETRMNKPFEVTAKGKGQGSLTVMSVYYALVTEKERQCNNFDLSIKVEEDFLARRPEGALSTYSLEICARHLQNVDATMSIIDVSMMTGFSPDIDSINKLMKGVAKYISKFEINKGASEKGTLQLYLDKVSFEHDECVKFNVHQIFPVGLIQPASATVYDYYNPHNRCTKFYHLDENSKLLGKICKDDVCRCAESNCFMQQNFDEEITAERRMELACGPSVDYVFKAKIDEIQTSDNYDNYVMTVTRVIKSGTDENVKGNQRSFISHIKCRASLDLKKGREYLIWGVTGDLWDQPNGYSYIIGKDTWIEWWPNKIECQDPQNEKMCDDFFILSENLEEHGCPS